MTQKVLKVGSSAAVTIPKDSLKELGLKIGDKVSVEVDKNRRVVSVRPVSRISKRQDRIAKLTLDFVDKYRSDLEELARK
jgi:antitoxin component of MazEF toxin-antitoxin module